MLQAHRVLAGVKRRNIAMCAKYVEQPCLPSQFDIRIREWGNGFKMWKGSKFFCLAFKLVARDGYAEPGGSHLELVAVAHTGAAQL